jgi:tetratricopeptide (TPR) repeat protein
MLIPKFLYIREDISKALKGKLEIYIIMIFFEPYTDSNFEWEWVETCYSEVFCLFNGSSLSAYWTPIKFKRITENEGKTLKPSDFPWFTSFALVMKKKAYDILADIFTKNGEILPLKTDDDIELYVFNSQVIDALDEDRSSVKRFSGSRKIMYIEKHEFVESKLLDVDMFRLPGRASELYLSERFVERYKSAGLVGLEFEEVWRSSSYKTAECHEKTVKSKPNKEKCFSKTDQQATQSNVRKPKPDFEKAWSNITLGYANEKDYDIIINFSKECIERNHEDSLAYSSLGSAYLHKQDYDGAIECYKKAIELNFSDLAAIYNNIGLAYFNKQDYNKSIEYHQKAVELEPDYAEAYFNTGNAYTGKQNYDKAIKCYEKAIELKPNLQAVYVNIGNAYDQKQDYNKAIEYFEKAIESKSDDVRAYFNMGNVYNKKQDYGKAIEYYKKAIALSPDCVDIHLNIGITYEEEQDYDKAIKHYEKVMELNPLEAGMIHYYIGDVYIKKGNTEKGFEYKNKAKNLGYKPET